MNKSIKIFRRLIGVGIPVCLVMGWQQKCIDRWREQADKNRAMFLLMNQWVNLKQEKRSLKEYFFKNEYKKIAVYGMGVVGQRLIKELRNSGIEISYGIDKNGNNIYSNIEVVTMEDDLTRVDAVVVTVINDFDEIRRELLLKMNCAVIAIEDILNQF